MSPAELACHDARDRVRVLDGAIRETRRGIDLRVAAGACSVEPMRRHLARLETRRSLAATRLAVMTGCRS